MFVWRGVDRHAGHKSIVLVALDRDGYELAQEGAEGLGILAAQEICLVPYAIVSQRGVPMFDYIALLVFVGFIVLMVAYPKIGAILAGLLVVAFLVTLAFSPQNAWR